MQAITAFVCFLLWISAWALAFSGCGGDGGDIPLGDNQVQPVVATPAPTPWEQCAVEVEGGIWLCLDENCANREVLDDTVPIDDSAKLIARKADGTVVNIAMCSNLTISESESTTTNNAPPG